MPATELVLVTARLEHAFALAPHMRSADVAELRACGTEPLEGLLYSLRVSTVACAVLVDDVVAALFGVEAHELGRTAIGRHQVGKLWLLTGPAFAEAALACARLARAVLAELLERFELLSNAIDGRHGDALRFAMLLGADFGPPFAMEPSGVPFVPFTFGRH